MFPPWFSLLSWVDYQVYWCVHYVSISGGIIPQLNTKHTSVRVLISRVFSSVPYDVPLNLAIILWRVLILARWIQIPHQGIWERGCFSLTALEIATISPGLFFCYSDGRGWFSFLIMFESPLIVKCMYYVKDFQSVF